MDKPLALDQTGPKSRLPTKQSDRYAPGMVIYEVLSCQVPFAPFGHHVTIRKVVRLQRPRGVEGAWFTDDMWQSLNQY